MKRYKALFAFLFALLHFLLRAQQDTLLASFDALREGNTIKLSWVIKGGSTCNGIRIYRGIDSVSFVQIGDIPGICGSSNSPVSYSFTDSNPVCNRKNYYRLGLGSYGFTRFISIDFFVLTTGGYLIIPNPVRDNTVIHFSNSDNLLYTFKFFTLQGQLVQTIENITRDSLSFNRYGIPNGEYIFILEDENSIRIRGKILLIQ